MVVIRLSRSGAKKRPFYHVVVADQRYPRGGRYIEKVGFYNPVAAGQDVKLQIEVDRVNHWVSQGAQASDRVNSLIKKLQKEQAA
ncbi:MAG: 30S ribosomal protein S16 [Gammaproteobacteria bacterium]|nr:30S ribosomal protein S16 [Gammaproteobacteria bacterium]